MHRLPTVGAALAVLVWGSVVLAQETWGTPTEPAPTTQEGGTTGWGQPAPESGGTTTGWGQTSGTQTGQSVDTESATTQQGGWGQQQTTPPPQQQGQSGSWGTSQAQPPPEEPAELTGNEFRLAHRLAIGGHTHMSGAFVGAGDAVTGGPEGGVDFTTPWLNVSFMYTITSLITIDAFVGFMVENLTNEGVGSTWFEMAFGPRLLFTLASGERTRLYTGLGLGLIIGYSDEYNNDDFDDGGCEGSCGGLDMYGVAVAVPIGFEYRFRSAPNLAFSAEFSLHLVYESFGMRTLDGDELQAEDLVGETILGLGNPRVTEGVANLFDYLNFITIGFHYLL